MGSRARSVAFLIGVAFSHPVQAFLIAVPTTYLQVQSAKPSLLRMQGGSSEREIQPFCSGTAKFTGVRFSLYPKGDHIKQKIKTAMSGVSELGVAVLPDDVSTCLIGPESRLFEALRAAFGRCAANGTMVSLQATFSAGCPGETETIEVPRKVAGSQLEAFGKDEWIDDAFSVNGMRIAAQFSLYPLGSPKHMEIIYQEIARAKTSPAWMPGKTHFCSMLDGDGDEVFNVLRRCFVNAQKECGHVVMTATLTANKRAWLEPR